MSIVIGSDRISDEQSHLLRMATGGGPPSMIADALIQVAGDGEILAGDEELHPKWLNVFQHNRRNLRRRLPLSGYKRVEKFFASAQPIDSEIASVDPTAARASFLLGAGASKPKPSGIPTVKELLPDLLTRARRLDRDEVTRLADFCDETRIDNIEDLLTAAQISEFCTRNPTILRLVDFLIFRGEPVEETEFRRARRPRVDVSAVPFLQDTLQVLFGLLSSRMLPAEPNAAHQAIVEYVRGSPETPVVTTNYDCCIDRALEEKSISFSYLIEFANQEPSSSAATVSVIKLHGSLNWFYCDTCQAVHLIDIEKTVSDYLEDRASYPVIGVCRNCGGQRRGLLVPPLAMKFDVAPPLNPLIDRADESFSKSDLIVVVGFSFADADLYISRMLSKAMQASE